MVDKSPIVCHFIRKESQLRATFINNQLRNYISFQPLLIGLTKLKNEVTVENSNFLSGKFFLSDSATLWDTIVYKVTKRISAHQSSEIHVILSSAKAAVLHFHFGSDAGIYFPVLKKCILPSVVSFYGYDCSSFPRSYFGLGRQWLKNRVFQHASIILAMSNDMKSDLIKLGCPKEKIIIHYHGCDIKIFTEIKREYVPRKKIVLLILAGLIPKKGHLFLLQAISLVLKKGSGDFELRIVGKGPMDSVLKRYVKKHSLSKVVSFIGPVKHASKSMIEEYSTADIFIHPSIIDRNGDKEGIPGTIIEAMASGLPVISTFHAGIPEIIENKKTGLLVIEGDIESLTEAIINLINDFNERKFLGESARKYAEKHLDIIHKSKELEEIYSSLIIG